MSSLQKKFNTYYSRVSVRVGDRKQDKRKEVYIKLSTDKYSDAKKRNAIVARAENKVRAEIRKGQASKSDLLNINEQHEWEWLKNDGSRTSIKLHTLGEYADKFIKYQGIKQRKKSTIQGYR